LDTHHLWKLGACVKPGHAWSLCANRTRSFAVHGKEDIDARDHRARYQLNWPTHGGRRHHWSKVCHYNRCLVDEGLKELYPGRSTVYSGTLGIAGGPRDAFRLLAPVRSP
jgi:hypothetical protein